MSLTNYASREINCKIVYCGTGLGGKTTNLEYVCSKVNPDAMHNLYENLESYGYDLTNIPCAMQYNKRDLPNAMTTKELRSQLNPVGVPDLGGRHRGLRGLRDAGRGQ